MFDELYRPLSSSLCSFIHSTVTLTLLKTNILLNTIFQNTHSLLCCLNVRDQVSHPYKRTYKNCVSSSSSSSCSWMFRHVHPVPCSSKWSWSLHLFLGRPTFLRPLRLYCSACFGILFVSQLCILIFIKNCVLIFIFLIPNWKTENSAPNDSKHFLTADYS
jgi:hypothetical protein